jgi:predicted outer membrane protein
MDRRLPQTIGLAVLTALLTMFVAQVDGAPVVREAAGRIAADSAGARDSSVTIKWLNDANVLSLVGLMTGRQIAASQIEAAGARSDTVRALAMSLAKEYADVQRSADSLGGMLHVAPVPSALNPQVYAEFQTQIDSIMMGKGGTELDRAYLNEQLASHKLMGSYLDQLSGVAQAPELQAWIESADGRVASQITRIEGQQRALVVADSIVADSLAKRAAARRKR